MTTNKERAHSMLNKVSSLTESQFNILKKYATEEFDKAERRGRRKGCPCCKSAPQFDAEKVRWMVKELEDAVAYSTSCFWSSGRKSMFSTAKKRRDVARDRLLAALGIELEDYDGLQRT